MLADLRIPPRSYCHRKRTSASDLIKKRALERLYQRRETIDRLIDTLQQYQEEHRASIPPCKDITSVRKCS